jgi:hypothetical protein
VRALGHLITRLVQITLGLVAAVLAAALFLSLGLFRGVIAPAIELHSGQQPEGVLVAVLALIGGPLIGAAVLLPSLFAVVFAELMAWRGMIANLLLGAAVALFAAWRHFEAVDAGRISEGALLVLLAAGFVGGFVYWLFSGRYAGR